jgi:DNA modification methylase
MAFKFSDDKAPLYLWHAGVKGIAAAAAAAAAAAGYEIRCELVWNKNQAQFGALSAQYKQKHEPAYYCFKRGSAPRWFGPTNEVTVWDVDRASKNEFHPTQKPTELATRAMRNSSQPGHVVLDLFLGSGATLIAAEESNRRCFGLELSPAYCDVIVARWEKFSGKKAERIRS